MYSGTKFAGVAAVGLIGTLLTPQAQAQSAGGEDAEIALLKQQVRLLEQKLEKLEKKTSANATAVANANAKADASAKAAAYPVKPVAPIDAVVHMPNNRPTICTIDEQNCIAITSRLHLDVGGYDYRPNTLSTNPQDLNNGINVRRARIGVLGKFLGDWNYALVYDFGGSSDGFASTGSFGASLPNTGGTSIGFLSGGGTSGIGI